MRIKEGFTLRRIGELWLIGTVQENAAASVFSVNEIGALLWSLLAQGKDEQQLLEAVLSEYDVDAETARADIQEFLEHLRTIGAVEEM